MDCQQLERTFQKQQNNSHHEYSLYDIEQQKALGCYPMHYREINFKAMHGILKSLKNKGTGPLGPPWARQWIEK